MISYYINFKKVLTSDFYYGIILLVSQWRLGQVVKTPPSHGGFKGSNPLGVTK